MALDLRNEKGIPLDRQGMSWREMAGLPISKLDCDAFTRVRVILMNGIEAGAIRNSHAIARVRGDLRPALAELRRAEQHQQTAVNWLLGADHSPLETTIGFEQVAIEVTAAVAKAEPDPYLAQVYRYGLLEDFDHLYRFAALLDRVEGKDANNILQSYTDILPGRPTREEHRAPFDDLREPYDRTKAAPLSKIHAALITAAEQMTHDYYMTVGPQFADPIARMLYAEIASIEEQHVTQYECLADPDETVVEKWLVHECMEAYAYWCCMLRESDPRVRAIWERFLQWELGHLHYVAGLYRVHEHKDPFTVLPEQFSEAIAFESHRAFVRQVLRDEVDLRALGTKFVPAAQVPADGPSARYRARLHTGGVASEVVAAGYRWEPGTELVRLAMAEGRV
ncbi:MAG: hypothetical protein ACOZNI_12895 [Myxococcota bacterium]